MAWGIDIDGELEESAFETKREAIHRLAEIFSEWGNDCHEECESCKEPIVAMIILVSVERSEPSDE